MSTTVAPRPLHRGLALALIAAPALWVAAELVSPRLESTASAQLRVVAADPGRWYVYTLLLLFGSIAAIPAGLGLMRLASDAMPRLAAVGGTLVTLGFVVSIPDAYDQFWQWQMVAAGADRGQMVALQDRLDNAAGLGLIFAVCGIGLLVGSVLLSIALVRTPGVPWWSAVTFGAAVLVNIAGFDLDSVPVLLASCALMFSGMVWIGVTHLRAPAAVPAADLRQPAAA